MSITAGTGKAEKAVVNPTANGYRLPTDAEWEYAARGGAFDSTAGFSENDYKNSYSLSSADTSYGFRVARNAD